MPFAGCLRTPKITGQEHFRPELHSCDALPEASPVLEESGRDGRWCETCWNLLFRDAIPKLFWIRVSSFSRNSQEITEVLISWLSADCRTLQFPNAGRVPRSSLRSLRFFQCQWRFSLPAGDDSTKSAMLLCSGLRKLHSVSNSAKARLQGDPQCGVSPEECNTFVAPSHCNAAVEADWSYVFLFFLETWSE